MRCGYYWLMKKPRTITRSAKIRELTSEALDRVVGGDDIGTPTTYTTTGQTGCTWVEATGARTVCVVQWT